MAQYRVTHAIVGGRLRWIVERRAWWGRWRPVMPVADGHPTRYDAVCRMLGALRVSRETKRG